MRTIILLLSLFALSLCTSRREVPGVVADIYKGLKSKIYKCVSESEGISTQLKDLAIKNLNADESLPLVFHSIELTKDDRKAIRTCKKEAFRKSTK